MAKSKIRLVRSEAEAAPRGRGPAASRNAAGEAAEAAPKKAARSVAMRLAAEVDRLQAELAAARAQVAQLEARADVDPLLDILNRRGFERELRRSLAYVRRYGASAALIYLDLDYFKPVNDRHGHAAGDRVLQAVAASLRRTVRESDEVARLGGDEFGVLLWNVSEIQAAAKARELESTIAATVVMQGNVPLSVGASAGVALLTPGDAPVHVISRADLAMYARKCARRVAAG
jgi:diguanylate cyclase (GGDEF)-like protein